jgi:hypothetical protein
MKLAALTIAATASLYALISLLAGFDTDYKVGVLVAIVALGAHLYLDHLEHERYLARREREIWDWRDEEFL